MYVYISTVCAQSDAAATIYFIARGAATIRERRLFESGDYTRAVTISFITAGHR